MTTQGPRRVVGRSLAALVVAGVMLTSPLRLLAQTSSSTPAPATDPPSNSNENSWWKDITFNGFLSASFTHNQNDPDSGRNALRVFDYQDGTPQIDVGELVVQHAVSKPNDFGFRVDFLAGTTVPEMTAAYGLFRDKCTGQAEHFDITQMYISYIVPVGKGLRLDAGKFVTHMGYEVIGGYDGYNDNFSRSFLFGFGIPFTHTGVKATYPFSDKLSGSVLVTQGWDDVHNTNKSVSIGTQLVLTPTKTASITFNSMNGPERQNNNHDLRSVYEVIGGWKATTRLTLAMDTLYGRDENAVSIGHDAIWKAVAGYAKYSFTDKFSLALRGEIFADNGGTRTGVDQTLQGWTLTPEYDLAAKFSQLNSHLKKLDGKFVLRGDLRLDRSNRDVFQYGNQYRRRQFTSAINLIYLL